MKTVAFLCFSFLYLRYTLCDCPRDSLEITCEDDVYEDLWNNNINIAFETLRVDFLQEMQNGSLKAERYINFTMQDINYIVTVTKMLKEMSEKEIQPEDIRDFIKARYLSYEKYTAAMLKIFSFKAEPTIEPTEAMKNYLSYYKELMEDPLHFVVGLLPCNRLWVWLAKNLKTPPDNAYYNWKKDNMDGHPEKYKPLLNKHLDTYEEKKKAKEIFHKQMQNEHAFFCSS
ncbi:hypothetical protein PO909_027606 [Leuciscus waleckii]